MANTGYVPTKEEREAAGMTEGEANAWANAYKQQMAASAAGGSKQETEYVRPEYDGPERGFFIAEWEQYGPEAAVKWAEAYNIHPAIIEMWLNNYTPGE
jgi:hypothetical protein